MQLFGAPYRTKGSDPSNQKNSVVWVGAKNNPNQKRSFTAGYGRNRLIRHRITDPKRERFDVAPLSPKHKVRQRKRRPTLV
jgi:hypothetical protein